MLTEVIGTSDDVKSMLQGIRRIPGFRDALSRRDASRGCPFFLIVDRPPHCRIGAGSPLVCLECPLSWGTYRPVWKFVTTREWNQKQMMTKVNHEGVKARVIEISSFDGLNVLTKAQRNLLNTAIAKGFFEFPRRITLTELSSVVGVRPWTLCQRLRAAELMIIQSAVQVGPQALQSAPASQHLRMIGTNGSLSARRDGFELSLEERSEGFIW